MIATDCGCVLYMQVQSIAHRGTLRTRSDKTSVHLLTHRATSLSANRRTHRQLGPDLQNILPKILRLSYDNAKVTIDLRRTSNLRNILRRAQVFSPFAIHLQRCKIV